MAQKDVLDNKQLVEASGYRIKYHPRGGIRDIFSDRSPALCVSGPKGTGKSLGVMHKQHLVLSKYPGSALFMARKTRASMTNSCLRTFQKEILKPPDGVHFHKQDQQFNYPNGSMYAVIGLDNPERLNSTNWDGGYIQECTECTLNDWEIASACVRFGTMPYKQLIGDCNPAQPKHWMKQLCDKGAVKMIKTFHKDNPRLWDEYANDWSPDGVAYLDRLRLMTGVRYKRLYLGEWAAAEGVVYEGWDPEIHMLSVSELPDGWTEWPHFWSIDWGFRDPIVWGDWMEDPQGRLYLYKQIYHTGVLVEDLADRVLLETVNEPEPYAIICDHDSGDRATFERHSGHLTQPAYKKISTGIQAVQARLRPDWGGKPGLFILRDSLVDPPDPVLVQGAKPTCTEEEWDGYVWDRKHNENSTSLRNELPVDKDNHGADMVRYACAFADSLSDDPEEFEDVQLYDDEMRISPY
jgi:phage terminase large subunit